MSLTLFASNDLGAATVVLPNPDLGNTEGGDLSVSLRRAIDGTLSTYVKSSGRKKLSYTWSALGRGKIVEVQEFFKLFAGDQIRLTDFRGAGQNVIFSDNPIEANINKRSVNSGGARKESGSLTLDFLGAGS